MIATGYGYVYIQFGIPCHIQSVRWDDPEAVLRIQQADDRIKENPGMAYPAVRRAAEWHEAEAEKLFAQADIMGKKLFAKKLEDPKRVWVCNYLINIRRYTIPCAIHKIDQ